MNPFKESQWVLSCIQHQEGRCCQTITGAGCEAAEVFLAHLKDGFDFTSWGRCWKVSCFSWSVKDVFCLHSPANVVCVSLWLGDSSGKNKWKGEIWKDDEGGWKKKKTEVESVLHFRLPKHVRQTQLVTVMQLTKPWYKFITDTQLVLKGRKKEGRKRQMNTWWEVLCF